MYRFHLITSNWSPIEIAKVDNNNITINKSHNKLVNKLNSDIVNYLVNENDKINFKIFESGDIKSYYYKKIQWRRCAAFLFIQISDMGLRHMCYFSDEVVHNAASFGTSMDNVSKEEVFKYIIEALTTDENICNVLKHVFNLTYDATSLTEELSSKFGI